MCHVWAWALTLFPSQSSSQKSKDIVVVGFICVSSIRGYNLHYRGAFKFKESNKLLITNTMSINYNHIPTILREPKERKHSKPMEVYMEEWLAMEGMEKVWRMGIKRKKNFKGQLREVSCADQ